MGGEGRLDSMHVRLDLLSPCLWLKNYFPEIKKAKEKTRLVCESQE